MRQREALNELYADILAMTKRKNRILMMVLCFSLILNVAFFCILVEIKAGNVNSIDDTIMMGAVAVKTQSEHIITRGKLKNIAEVKTFNELLDRCILTDDEKYILREHYLHGRSFQSIAMELNFSEDWIKHRHQKILKRIQKLL